MKPHKMNKKQAKKIASKLGMPVKDIMTVVIDMQKMGILKHIDRNVWRIFDGKEWQTLEL